MHIEFCDVGLLDCFRLKGFVSLFTPVINKVWNNLLGKANVVRNFMKYSTIPNKSNLFLLFKRGISG